MTVTDQIARQKFPLSNLRRVAGNIGAQVNDITRSAGIADDAFAQLDAAVVIYKVLFFRHQRHLTDEAHQAFGARFGTIVAHPTVPAPAGAKFIEPDASKSGGRRYSRHTINHIKEADNATS